MGRVETITFDRLMPTEEGIRELKLRRVLNQESEPISTREIDGKFYVLNGRNRSIVSFLTDPDQLEVYVANHREDYMPLKLKPAHMHEQLFEDMQRYILDRWNGVLENSQTKIKGLNFPDHMSKLQLEYPFLTDIESLRKRVDY